MRKFLLLLVFFFLSVQQAKALSQFTTNYQISYQIQDSGKTHVVYKISQTNNLSRVYATEFSLSVSHTNIENLKVKDFQTLIDPDIILTDNITSINFPFKNKIVGKDKTHQFSIEYDTEDIAIKTGSIWEVNIPKITSKENINQLTVELHTPPNFPNPVYIDPKPTKISDNTLTFSSHALASKPISAIFGQEQFFNLKAHYYLDNSSSSKQEKTIALPPNTSYQQVYIKSIHPDPTNITTDPDGNWLATYTLNPKQSLHIYLEQIIRLNFIPQAETNQKIDLSKYLEPTDTWNHQSLEFQDVNLTNFKNPQQIFDYVTTSLIYNYSLVRKDPLKRQSASFALTHPTQAICTNFTDLFVALSRKNHIPAREIQGFALSTNDKLKPLSFSKDVLHAWPEYFDQDKKTWIQVDPTWTNTTNGVDYFTKLDLNHITFVIHGQDPVYPLPAGFYKNPNINTQEKDVELVETSPVEFPKPKISLSLLKQLGNKLILKVDNSSGVALKTNLQIVNYLGSTHPSTPLYLPPLSHQEVSLDLNSRPILGNTYDTITIKIGDQVHDLPVVIKPILSLPALTALVSLFLLLIVLIFKKVKKSNSVIPSSIRP
jgi:hypothetical protein